MWAETTILLTTFFATLFLELEFAIYLGVLLSLIFFLARKSTPQIVTQSLDGNLASPKRSLVVIAEKPLKQYPQLRIIRIDMSLYFGSINHIQNRITRIAGGKRIYNILIEASGINFIDLAGAEAQLSENNRLRRMGGGLYFVGLKQSAYEFAAKIHFVRDTGRNNFSDRKHEAIREIYERPNHEVCETCPALTFRERNRLASLAGWYLGTPRESGRSRKTKPQCLCSG